MPETPIEHWNYTINEWSREPFNKIIDSLPELNVVFDVGANVGGFTDVLFKKYPDAEFYCFEPIKDNFDALVDNVPYAECIQKGIYYGAKTSKATWRGSNIGAFFLDQVDSGEPRIFTGEVVDLMEFEELDVIPDLIKLDVEGAEENILEYSKVCKRCPNLIIEWHLDHVPVLDFFKKHLPNHKIVVNLEDKQFLLCLK
jgi:FkbM family methyltransferase